MYPLNLSSTNTVLPHNSFHVSTSLAETIIYRSSPSGCCNIAQVYATTWSFRHPWTNPSRNEAESTDPSNPKQALPKPNVALIIRIAFLFIHIMTLAFTKPPKRMWSHGRGCLLEYDPFAVAHVQRAPSALNLDTVVLIYHYDFVFSATVSFCLAYCNLTDS